MKLVVSGEHSPVVDFVKKERNIMWGRKARKVYNSVIFVNAAGAKRQLWLGIVKNQGILKDLILIVSLSSIKQMLG